jgi:tRNA (guanine26-N2/guanine27-N2)-dimethyltransferase
MKLISEQSVHINASIPKKDVNRKMPVFYNPRMVSNRNISILLVNSIENKEMNLAFPLTGSGVRPLRFLKELKQGKINHLFVNDRKETFEKTFKENLKINKIPKKNISIFNEDASLFLLNRIMDKKKPSGYCGYFDYIDLDPFGTPNPFLNAATARISRKGIIAITATDTAALSGTYPQVTRRKYWAKTRKNYMMHELGLRILIRKVQLQGAQFDKALTPVLAYHKDHYFRIYFRSENGKKKCDAILDQHKFMLYNPKTLDFETSKSNTKEGYDSIGPLWVGNLKDQKLVERMLQNNTFEKETKFLTKLKEEKEICGFYDYHVIAKKYKIPLAKKELLLKKLNASITHFSPMGFKTNKKIDEIIKIL